MVGGYYCLLEGELPFFHLESTSCELWFINITTT
jgi:hypothetical protein